jgi:dipeptidyl aminopeptidase/acylaminoacyl peptidase
MTKSARRRPQIVLDELCRLSSFFLPAVSWKGDCVAFYWDKTGRMELHVLDLATGDTRQVSHGEVPRELHAGFVWDRAGRAIVFAKDVGGNERHDLYRIDVETGAVTQLTNDPGVQEDVEQFSPDDQWLTVRTNKRQSSSPDTPGQLNLWRMRADGSDYGSLTNYAAPVFGGQWSPDGQLITYMTNENLSDLKNLDTYVMRADGTGAHKVLSVREGSKDTVADWHPDGGRLAVTSDASGQNRAGVLDLATGQVRWLGERDAEEEAIRFSKDGRLLAVSRNVESSVRSVVYDVASGEAHELALTNGFAVGVSFFDSDRKLLVSFSSDVTRDSLLSYDLVADTYETLLAAEYGTVDRSLFVKAEHIYYPTFDGRKVPALLYAPRDIASGERLPGLVFVHGGPTGQFLRAFDPFAQFLVDRGLVVFGGSYGGFMAYLAATKKPDLWHAAVAAVGITDLHRLYENSMEHFKYILREQMGDPEKDRALWRDRSAIEFADRLRAKLLMVQAVNDARVPVDQSRTFRDRLLDLGKREGEDFEYVELGDEGHGFTDIAQKIRLFSLLADYLDRAL